MAKVKKGIDQVIKDGMARDLAFILAKLYLQKNNYNPMVKDGFTVVDILEATNISYKDLTYSRRKEREDIRNIFAPIEKRVSKYFKKFNTGLIHPTKPDLLFPKLSTADKASVTELLYYLITFKKQIAIVDFKKISSKTELARQFRFATGIKLSHQYWSKQLATNPPFYPDIKNRLNERKKEKLHKTLSLKFKHL